MSMNFRAATRSAVLACITIAAAASANDPAPNIIAFLPDDVLPESVLSEFLAARHAVEYRVVEVDADALRQTIRDVLSMPTAADTPTIRLPLPDRSVVSIELIDAGESHEGWQTGLATFRGKISGDELSSVQCVIAPDGSISLLIRRPGKRYKLESSALLPYHIYWLLGGGFSQKFD